MPEKSSDGSQGRGHRDVLDRDGETLRKDWLPGSPGFSEALNVGVQDLTERWMSYREAFLARERWSRRGR